MKLFKLIFFSLFLLGVVKTSVASNMVSPLAIAREYSSLVEILIEFDIKNGSHIFAPYEQEFGSPLKVHFIFQPYKL